MKRGTLAVSAWSIATLFAVGLVQATPDRPVRSAAVALRDLQELAPQGRGDLSFLLDSELGQTSFATGDTARVTLRARGTGVSVLLDFYTGLVLPDGSLELFTRSGRQQASFDDPSGWQPSHQNVDLSQPGVSHHDALIEVPFSSEDPVGDYRLFLAAAWPGSLADNYADRGDIVAIDVIQLSVDPGKAKITSRSGKTTLRVAGKRFKLKVTDPLGKPIPDVIAALVLRNKAFGVLLLVDPVERFDPKIILLRGKRPSAGSGLRIRASKADRLSPVLTVGGTVSTLDGLETNQLKAFKLGTNIGVPAMIGQIGAALKLADKVATLNGYPSLLERYEPQLKPIYKKLEPAKDELKLDLGKSVALTAAIVGLGVSGAWFTGGVSLGTALALVAPGVAITSGLYALDRHTVMQCIEEATNKKPVCVADLGFTKIYACRKPFVLENDLEAPVRVDPKTPSGNPLCRSSVDLVSYDAVGEGFRGPACQEFPVIPGDYALNVRAPGRPLVAQDETVPPGGKTVEVTVPAAEVHTWTINVQASAAGVNGSCSKTAKIGFGGSKSFPCDIATATVLVSRTRVAVFGFGFSLDPEVDCNGSGSGSAALQESSSQYMASGSITGTVSCTFPDGSKDTFPLTGSFSASANK